MNVVRRRVDEVALSRKAFSLSALAVLAGALSTPGRASAQAGPYAIEADVLRGNSNSMGADCVATSVFYPGDDIVWRVVISDRSTGAPLDAAQIAELGIKAVVKMRGADDIQLHYGSHPPGGKPAESEHYWSCNYPIAKNRATGTLPWSIMVSDAKDRSSTFTPIGQNIGLAVLTVVAKPTKT